MRNVAILLRARLRMVVNTVLKQSREKRGWAFIFIFIAIAAEIFFFRIANAIFSVTIDGQAQRGDVITGALTIFGGFVLVTSITFALSSLYFARDLDALLSAPIRPADVILSRMYTQLALGVAIGLAFVGPPLLAYLHSVGRLAMAPLIAIVILTYASLPLSLATAGVIGGLRLIPARYVRDSAGLVVTVAVLIVAAVNLFLRGPEAFTSTHISQLPLAQTGHGAAGSPWSPARWAANAIGDAINGDLSHALLWSLPFVALALGLPLLLSHVLGRAYVVGYQRNAVARTGAVRRKVRNAQRLRTVPLWLTLAVKDLRQTRRDPSQIGQLALPLVLFAFYLAKPGGSSTLGSVLPAWLFVSLSATFASLLFAANIALRGIGMEGQKLWILRIAPLNVRDLLLSKFFSGFVVSAIPAAILFVIGEWSARATLLDALLPLLRMVVLIATVTSIAVGLGAIRPRLDWTDPRRAVGIGITIIYLTTASVYVTVAFIVFGIPYAFGAGKPVAVGIADLVVLLASAVIVAAMSYTAGLGLARLEL